MKYYLIMTEGNTEKTFLEILSDRNLLKYKKDELLYHKIFQLRQIDNATIHKIYALPKDSSLVIIRVGDTLSDELKIPNEIKYIFKGKTIDVCTKPEFEILMIINDGLYEDYLKVKSITKPSRYYTKKNKKYDKSSEYTKKYFNNLTDKEIIDLVKEEHKLRNKANRKSAFTLKYLIIDF